MISSYHTEIIVLNLLEISTSAYRNICSAFSFLNQVKCSDTCQKDSKLFNSNLVTLIIDIMFPYLKANWKERYKIPNVETLDLEKSGYVCKYNPCIINKNHKTTYSKYSFKIFIAAFTHACVYHPTILIFKIKRI